MYFWSQVQDKVISAILVRLGWTAVETSNLSYDDFRKVAEADAVATLPVSHFA